MGNEIEHQRVYDVWQSEWANYIAVSKRASTTAHITANSVIRSITIRSGYRVLDLGCGHGRITELLATKVPQLDIVGVDMTRQLLDNFVLKPGVNGCKVALVCGDISKLPFDDNEFDAVVSSRAFQYLTDPILCLSEAHRLVKPGGGVAISIPNKWNLLKCLTYRDAKLYSPSDVRNWFRICDFENIESGSMCFWPAVDKWRQLAFLFEFSSKIPLLKYGGGNVLAYGRKKLP